MKVLALLFLLALLAAAGYAGYLVYAPIGPPPGTSDTNATYVDIPPGTPTQAIAAKLQQAHVIRSRYAFDILRILQRGNLRAGEYRFNHPAPATEVYRRILRGDVYTRSLTIPEGYNIFDIANAVQRDGLGQRDAFLAAERSQTALIADLSPNATSLEGFLFPDTYRFPVHSPPEVILATMVHHFREVAAQLHLTSGPDGNLIHTVILASLVEKEVSQVAERPLVAGVFDNRLAQGMPLATDPTVIYAALLDGRYRGTIYASDLQNPSPYNTYVHRGLPPGPICNPGLASLQAALNPAQTDYLYFVADAAGHSRFSATLKEHAQQVLDYREAMHEPITPPHVPHNNKQHHPKPHPTRRHLKSHR